MSDDKRIRTDEREGDNVIRYGRRATDNDQDRRQRANEGGEDQTAADEIGEDGGGEGDDETPEFVDEMDLSTGVEATAAYHQATADHDPKEGNHQIAEHYTYVDADIERYGHF